jgi:hypothetical protein
MIFILIFTSSFQKQFLPMREHGTHNKINPLIPKIIVPWQELQIIKKPLLPLS